MTSNREQLIQAMLARKQKQGDSDLWEVIKLRIGAGQVLPIISNSILDSLVFPLNKSEEHGVVNSPDEILAELWAIEIDYPFLSDNDNMRLSRVAQYASYAGLDTGVAKSKYLRLLKNTLLDFAEPTNPQGVADIRKRKDLENLTFTQVASELDYPQAPPGKTNPLNVLARLPLPVYVTTSFYGFMERALLQEGKQPITHVCFWDERIASHASDFYPETGFKPDPNKPVVYHLLGYEKIPSSLVLSEDDYLEFLKGIARDQTNQPRPVVPSYLRESLSTSSLIMMGYSMSEWDFRALFRGVIPLYTGTRVPASFTIQMDPQLQNENVNVQKARDYLKAYFIKENFQVVWRDVISFVDELSSKWQEWWRE